MRCDSSWRGTDSTATVSGVEMTGSMGGGRGYLQTLRHFICALEHAWIMTSS
jgi:hypothetical protein